MDALRVRLGSLVEWAIAAMFLAATFAVGSLVIGELSARRIRPSAPAARTGCGGDAVGRSSRRRLGSCTAVQRWEGDPRRRHGGRCGHPSRPRRGKRPPGSRSRHPRRAADPLLRVRGIPVHRRVRAVRAQRRSTRRGDLLALARSAGSASHSDPASADPGTADLSAYLRERRPVPVHVHRAQRTLQRDAALGDLVGHGNRHVLRRPSMYDTVTVIGMSNSRSPICSKRTRTSLLVVSGTLNLTVGMSLSKIQRSKNRWSDLPRRRLHRRAESRRCPPS